MFCLLSHYNENVDYRKERMSQAVGHLSRILGFVSDLRLMLRSVPVSDYGNRLADLDTWLLTRSVLECCGVIVQAGGVSTVRNGFPLQRL